MKLPNRFLLPFLAASFLTASTAFAQNPPIRFEAESGTRGAELTLGTDGAVQYLAPATSGAGGNPGSAARVSTYTVTFPAAGTYELYARIRVGAESGNDDSMFYGSSFGAKSATTDADWITVNQLFAAGYTASESTVGGGGSAGTGVWKWIKLSDFTADETGVTFEVPAGALTQTLQIGAREDGLWLDKFAFGLRNVAFTVSNLDNGTAGSATTPPDAYIPTGPPLATGKSKFLGSAYSSPTQTLYFERYWNQVTPENAGKWGSVEGTRDVMNWAALDAAYQFAKEHGFPFKLHTLIWGSQQPAWIDGLPPAEQLEEITEWYAAAAARYPALDYIDVVNEPIRATPNQSGNGRVNYINALGGTGATGWDWVITSFQMARQYFPRAKLILNEYSVTNSSTVTANYAAIVQLLKDRNLIDGIGLQQHAFETRGVASTTLRTNLDTLAALGLPIYVTELDIDGLSDQAQREEYERVFPLFWEHPSVQGITLWGWRPGLWRNDQGAYIVLENGAERPAMRWLKEYLNNAPVVARQSFTLPEGTAAGTVVGTVAGLDWESDSIGTWTITGGTGAALFSLDATTGQLSVASSATLQAQDYTLQITTRDALRTSEAGEITVRVTNQAQKVVGTGYELAANIQHANGNVYDQVLITGPSTTIRADPGQVVRASYLDLTHDIVQVEFAGAGTLTIALAGATPAAPPERYNQNVSYVRGHATITVAGADASTHVSVFTVGRVTAVNQALFKDNVTYDGFADLAAMNISSPSNTFGGCRLANVEFWALSGNTGISAPGVAFAGPVFVHNIAAEETATPVLMTGTIGTYFAAGETHTNTILITGGDMLQPNGRAVQVGDVGRIVMRAGTDSHGNLHAEKTNRAVYERNGVNVTGTLIP